MAREVPLLGIQEDLWTEELTSQAVACLCTRMSWSPGELRKGQDSIPGTEGPQAKDEAAHMALCFEVLGPPC